MPQQLPSLAPTYTQATRLLRLTTPLGRDQLLVERVRGEESIGTPFSFTLSVLSLDAHLPLRRLLGQPALLELLTVKRAALRSFHGQLTRVETSPYDDCGRPRFTRPLMRGQQTAIVVGPSGANIHTDRDHRVKVQFRWQRSTSEAMSHSRLSHPWPEGTPPSQ